MFLRPLLAMGKKSFALVELECRTPVQRRPTPAVACPLDAGRGPGLSQTLVCFLVSAACLTTLNACRIVDTEATGKERPRTAANPRLAYRFPTAAGASNL